MPKKPKEMLRYLEKYGVQVVKGGGKGGHLKVRNPANNLSTVIPMHSKELSKKLEHKILKELGLE